MTRTPNDPGAVHVFMSTEDKINAYKNFSKIYGKQLPHIRRRLSEDLYNLESGSMASISRIVAEKIPRGLIAIIDGVDGIFNNDKILAYFFLHYFNAALAQSDADGEKSLKGRFKDALNIKHKFCDLFWELAVANTYMSHGNTVEFVPPSQDRFVKTPDLLVHGQGNKLWVECKCVSVLSRQPVADDLVGLFARILKKNLSQLNLPQFVVRAHLKAGREVNRSDALLQLDEISQTISADGGRAESSLWMLEINIDYSDLTNNISKTLLMAPGDKPEILQGFATTTIGENHLLVLSADQDSEFNRTIGDRVTSALKQLPEQDLRIIWIQASGYLPRSLDEINKMMNWAFSDSRTQSLVRANSRLKNGFIGVTLGTDFSIEEREGHDFLNYFAYGLHTTHLPDLYRHHVEMMRQPEKDLELKLLNAMYPM